MNASVVDIRYKMKDVLNALRRNETVNILYHGKVAGTIYPPKKTSKSKVIKKHPFFGMHEKHYKNKSMESIMDELRGGRYHAI